MSKESCSVKVHYRGLAFDFLKIVCHPVVQSRARIPWELQGSLTFPGLLRGGGSGGLGGGSPWLFACEGISNHGWTACFLQI